MDGVAGGPVIIPPETFSQDLKRLLIEEIAPDFEVVVQNEVIRTHKFVLVARSRYFASCILTSGMVEAQAGRLVIPSTSAMTADAFRAFLRFLYAGDDILQVLEPHTAMYLVEASSFYGLTNSRLKHFCELCVNGSLNEAHVLQLFEASSRLNVEAVRSMALDFIITHFQSVCRQPAMEQLDKPLLVDILKSLADRLPVGVASNTVSTTQPQSLG
jgi:speckle-type POZ protein